MHSWNKIVLGLITLFSCSAVFSNNFVNYQPVSKSIVTLSGGLGFTANAGSTTTFPIRSGTYAYASDSSMKVQTTYGGFIGKEYRYNSLLAWQVGLAYYLTPITARGNLIQGADPQSYDHYRYHYDIVSQQYLLDNKLLFNTLDIYHPYISFALGTALNHANHYTTSNSPFLTFTPAYSSHTKNPFTYNVGLGVDIDLHYNWRLGLGYRFVDLGSVELKTGMIDTILVTNSLTQTHIYSNELLAQLTYLM